MKRFILIAAFAIITLGGATSCNSNANKHGVAKTKGKYTCTMHPNLSFDKPGVCPKCGMTLVERDTSKDR